jgi:hypothetical protein
VRKRGVLGWERRGGSAAEKGEFWASFWAASRGQSQAILCSKGRPNSGQLQQLLAGLFLGILGRGKEAESGPNSTSSSRQFLDRPYRPYLGYTYRLVRTVQNLAGPYSHQLGEFAEGRKCILLGNFSKKFHLVCCCNLLSRAEIKPPLCWFSPHWGFQGTSCVVHFMCVISVYASAVKI